jgi:SOS-response transcriptional repressor LexA
MKKDKRIPPNNLRRWRVEEKHWSIDKLATELGTTKATISRIEKLVQQPRTDILNSICTLFNKSVSDFYYAGEISMSMVPLGTKRIPVISAMQAAQLINGAPYPLPAGNDFALADDDLSDYAFAIAIADDEMAPDLNKGDRVVVDPAAAFRPGDAVMASVDHKLATIRQYRPKGCNDRGVEYFELVPINPVYAPMRSDFQNIRIIGRVMEQRRKFAAT